MVEQSGKITGFKPPKRKVEYVALQLLQRLTTQAGDEKQRTLVNNLTEQLKLGDYKAAIRLAMQGGIKPEEISNLGKKYDRENIRMPGGYTPKVKILERFGENPREVEGKVLGGRSRAKLVELNETKDGITQKKKFVVKKWLVEQPDERHGPVIRAGVNEKLLRTLIRELNKFFPEFLARHKDEFKDIIPEPETFEGLFPDFIVPEADVYLDENHVVVISDYIEGIKEDLDRFTGGITPKQRAALSIIYLLFNTGSLDSENVLFKGKDIVLVDFENVSWTKRSFWDHIGQARSIVKRQDAPFVDVLEGNNDIEHYKREFRLWDRLLVHPEFMEKFMDVLRNCLNEEEVMNYVSDILYENCAGFIPNIHAFILAASSKLPTEFLTKIGWDFNGKLEVKPVDISWNNVGSRDFTLPLGGQILLQLGEECFLMVEREGKEVKVRSCTGDVKQEKLNDGDVLLISKSSQSEIPEHLKSLSNLKVMPVEDFIISNPHLEIRVLGERVRISDLHSAYGTLLWGRPALPYQEVCKFEAPPGSTNVFSLCADVDGNALLKMPEGITTLRKDTQVDIPAGYTYMFGRRPWNVLGDEVVALSGEDEKSSLDDNHFAVSANNCQLPIVEDRLSVRGIRIQKP